MTLPERYARAIYEARTATVLTGREFIVRITEALKRRHHERLLPSILEAYRKVEEIESMRGVTLRVASGADVQSGLAKMEELGVGEKEARTIIDPSLVKGYVLSGKDFRYDASAKRALVKLYERLSASA